MEFGPASAVGTTDDRAADNADSGTQAGMVLGTPAYMPPEQAAGRIDVVDQRADVFALGAMLCQILTGAPPYIGDTSAAFMKATLGDTADARARLDASGAEEELIRLAKQCLSADPAARPADSP